MSKNQLEELPEQFGDLVKLRHLDLYRNKLQYLPLSFGNLKALKWLDLKDNPLVSAVAKVAGPCVDSSECQKCAKDVVSFYTKVGEQVATDLEMRQKQRKKQQEANQAPIMEAKMKKNKDKNKKKDTNHQKQVQQTKKIKKAPSSSEKKTTKTSSPCLKFIALLFISFSAIFVLTSIDCEYTKNIQVAVTALFDKGAELLPVNCQLYVVKFRNFVGTLHGKSGDLTRQLVGLFKDNENFASAYKTVNGFFETVLNKVKQQFSS